MSQDSKTKVILVGPLPPPAGGVEIVTRSLLDSDLVNRYEIIHCDITKKRGKEKCGKFDLGNTFWAYRHIRSLVSLIREHRPPIVYMPISSTNAGFLRDSVFVTIAKRMGTIVVGHVHGGAFDRLAKSPWPLSWWVRRTMRKPDVLIALAEVWKSLFLKLAPNACVEIIPTAVQEAFLQQVLPVEPQGRTGKQILFVGAVGKRKGVFDLIKAAPLVAAKVPGVHFVIVGPEHYEGELKQIRELCESTCPEGLVEFTGPLFNEDKIAQYLAADIFTLPSYHENFPSVILEAMAAKMPVVSTPIGAMPEAIEEGINGFLVPPGDVQGLADRLAQLCLDSELRAKMAETNREKVARVYRYSRAVDRLDEIFSGLTGRRTKEAVR